MHTWIFHRGALGDSILLWPRIRTEQRAARAVTLVTDLEKASLAADELGITGLDAESRRFNDLWLDSPRIEPVPDVQLVICAGGGGDPSGPWGRNIRRMFPNAALEIVGRTNRALYRGTDPAAGIAPRENPRGPVVVHVGAGSETKRWPVQRWDELLKYLPDPVQVIAGEVERERLTAQERTILSQIGGKYVENLKNLASIVKLGKLFVGCDSGPTHLAAALGIPTLALFGPTDPALWAPIGPRTTVLAPPMPAPMSRLGINTVLAAVRAGIGQRPRM